MNASNAACSSIEEVFAVIAERESKAIALYRGAAERVQGEAKKLLERLYQRAEGFLAKLEEGKRNSTFKIRECALPDYRYFKTMAPPSYATPGERVPEILIFAIMTKHDDYLMCKRTADKAGNTINRELWLLMAEENRRQRLELEAYYEKEVINKI